MHAARWKADGVAKLLIEAKADLDATGEVRPEGAHICICVAAGWWSGGQADRLHHRRMHACAEAQ